MSEHTSVRKDHEAGVVELAGASVYYKDGRLIICGRPVNDHDCDEMGCSTLEHVLVRASMAYICKGLATAIAKTVEVASEPST